jgi:hypothetical protein
MMITIEDLKYCGMREDAHYNGGKEFFAYLLRCTQHPRLSRYDRYSRTDRSVTSTWRVDGKDQPSLEAAVEALNSSPAFSPSELAVLATITTEPADRRKEMIANSEPWEGLREKGAIIWEKGRCRISDAGRLALQYQGGDAP